MIPKIYKLILRSFIGPFFATFFVTTLILLIQFLFKYIDDLAGKGLDGFIILELLGYSTLTLVPVALPLAVLLSSLMTFGNLAEHYELVALKSSGISLRRIMMPLFVFSIILSICSFLIADKVVPWAFLKQNSLLYDVQKKKPTLNIAEGVFYSGIDGYSIRIKEKNNETGALKDIIIYDHSEGKGNRQVILADSGSMNQTPDGRFLTLTLYSGIQYQETSDDKASNSRDKHLRVRFEQQEVKFDLSSFDMSRTDENLFKDGFRMQDVRQLKTTRDSLHERAEDIYLNLYQFTSRYFKPLSEDSMLRRFTPVVSTEADLFNLILSKKREQLINRAMANARNVKSRIDAKSWEADRLLKREIRYAVEFHRRFTLAVACIVLFLIGAPLGAIIRKGGLGVPVVISVFFFVVFHILTLSGEKFSRELVLDIVSGMWSPTFILLPVGLFITYKATSDSNLLDKKAYTRVFKRIFKRKKAE